MARHGPQWSLAFSFFPHSLQISGASSMGAAAVHRAYCMPLQFDCRTTGKRKRERLPAWQLNSNNRQSHNVFSLYGWLLARVQTGNYCIWIDSDVHVRSRCIAPAMYIFHWQLRHLIGDDHSKSTYCWFWCCSSCISFERCPVAIDLLVWTCWISSQPCRRGFASGSCLPNCSPTWHPVAWTLISKLAQKCNECWPIHLAILSFF